MADPSSVVDSVVKILGHIQTLTNNWCEASDAYKDFPGKVGAVRTRLNYWKKGVDERGLSWDETLAKSLREAETRLQKEETELQKRIPKEGSRHAWGLRAKLKMTVLPGQIDKSVNRIEKVLDDVLKNIHDEREISAVLDERLAARKPTLGFQRDKRYVRLPETEELVRIALTQPGGPKVVLLHGGPGKGKSCLARDVALQIEASGDAESSQQPDLGTPLSTDPNQLATTFDKVVYIECGQDAEIPTMQLDLLQKLGRGAHASDDKKAQVDSNQPILKGLLQSQKILIIFDDVWSPTIVSSIIHLSGSNVKCLLTSQIADLCRPLNCTHRAIPIENMNSTCARKILASHILGHEDGISDEMYNIPKHLEDLADEIILKVDANPLAMACVATSIDHQSFQDVRVWQKVVEDFSDSLDSIDTAMIHNSEHPRSFWVAIQKSFERLTKEEKKLFILVSLCRGPSVPEEVVEYLYKLLKVEGFSQFFLKAKGQLESRQLIQTRENSCSLHSLLQQFIDRKLGTNKSSIESQLKKLSKSDDEKGISELDREVDPHILKAIISLYFSQEIASTSGTTMDTSRALDKGGYVLEPITRLLLFDIRDLPMAKLRSHVRQLFLRFVKFGFLHEEAAIKLLRSSNSKYIAAITNVLVRFAQAPNNNISVGDEVIYTLLGLLSDKNLYLKVYSVSQDDLLSRIADAVYWLQKLNTKHGKAFDSKDTTLFTYITAALPEISSAMAMNDNHHLQQQAISALENLSWIPYASVSRNIATPRILGELGKIWNEDDHQKNREAVAITFGNISLWGGQHVCQEIVSIPTTLQGLVSTLTSDDNPDLQVQGARALQNLANKGGASIALKISCIPKSLESLVGALTKASNPELQMQAAWALGELACKGGYNVCIQISNVPTALEELIRAVEMNTNHDFQTQAAVALVHLANRGGPSIAMRISCIPKYVERLVGALTTASNPEFQREATEALCNLVYGGNQDVCKQISNVPRALEELIHAVEMDTNPNFQVEAARALQILVDEGGPSIAFTISSIPKSLESLVAALNKASNPQLQKQAAWALGELALEGGHDVCRKISNVPTALEELIHVVEMDTNLDFQAKAARALVFLAHKGGASIAMRISCILKYVERLVGALTTASNPEFQREAAKALGDLACEGNQDLCMQISNVPRALEELIHAVEMDTDPDFQVEAARALQILVDKGGASIAFKISSIPKSLESLVGALNKVSNPQLQKQVVWALGELALKGGHDVCKQISNVPTALEELIRVMEMDTNLDFQAKAARALVFLADKGGASIALRISSILKYVERLVGALTTASNPEFQTEAAKALGNLACEGNQDLCIQISNVPRALEELIHVLEMDTNPDFQVAVAEALQKLAQIGGASVALRISCIPKSLEGLVSALTKASNPELQKQVAWVFWEFASQGSHDVCKPISCLQGSFREPTNGLERNGNVDGVKLASRSAFSILATCKGEPELKLAELPGLIENLVALANDSYINSPKLDASAQAIGALTLIDPSRGQQIVLHSAHSYAERGLAELLLGLYKESLKDLNEAWQIQPPNWDADVFLLCNRITVKAQLDDFPGALADANSLIEKSRTPFYLQQRGVLKCMMNDLHGALEDLDEGLNLEPNHYEHLKHRGYVKFLLQDEIGARADAEKALEIKPSGIDFYHYGLGVSSVEYMGYQLH